MVAVRTTGRYRVDRPCPDMAAAIRNLSNGIHASAITVPSLDPAPKRRKK